MEEALSTAQNVSASKAGGGICFPKTMGTLAGRVVATGALLTCIWQAPSPASLHAEDTKPPAPKEEPRYYVKVDVHMSAAPELAKSEEGKEVRNKMETIVENRLQEIPGVRVIANKKHKRRAIRAAKRKKAVAYVIDANVVRLERSESSIRAGVAVLLRTLRGKHLRALLRGKSRLSGDLSTVSNGEEQAIKGALDTALESVDIAMLATARKDTPQPRGRRYARYR